MSRGRPHSYVSLSCISRRCETAPPLCRHRISPRPQRGTDDPLRRFKPPVPPSDTDPAPTRSNAQPDASRLVAQRLRARERRVSVIRRRVVAIALALFLALWSVIFLQLVSGNDPASRDAPRRRRPWPRWHAWARTPDRRRAPRPRRPPARRRARQAPARAPPRRAPPRRAQRARQGPVRPPPEGPRPLARPQRPRPPPTTTTPATTQRHDHNSRDHGRDDHNSATTATTTTSSATTSGSAASSGTSASSGTATAVKTSQS